MSVGVINYCTQEGGSGYITDAAAPWLSTFDITQESPVFDQTTAWLRDSQPGSFTFYQRFGPPYSQDGGTLPPYAGEDGGMSSQPQPILSGNACGMSGLGGVDEATCTQIQCGAISQSDAGALAVECMNAGYVGAFGCSDPQCAPYLSQIPGCAAGAPPSPLVSPPPTATLVLTRAQLIAPMPSITATARASCPQAVNACPSELDSLIDQNPLLAIGLAAAAGAFLWAMFGGKR